jgi:hypothetical protein
MLGVTETGRFVLYFWSVNNRNGQVEKPYIVWRGENVKEMISNAREEGLVFQKNDNYVFGGYFVDENGNVYLPDIG